MIRLPSSLITLTMREVKDVYLPRPPRKPHEQTPGRRQCDDATIELFQVLDCIVNCNNTLEDEDQTGLVSSPPNSGDLSPYSSDPISQNESFIDQTSPSRLCDEDLDEYLSLPTDTSLLSTARYTFDYGGFVEQASGRTPSGQRCTTLRPLGVRLLRRRHPLSRSLLHVEQASLDTSAFDNSVQMTGGHSRLHSRPRRCFRPQSIETNRSTSRDLMTRCNGLGDSATRAESIENQSIPWRPTSPEDWDVQSWQISDSLQSPPVLQPLSLPLHQELLLSQIGSESTHEAMLSPHPVLHSHSVSGISRSISQPSALIQQNDINLDVLLAGSYSSLDVPHSGLAGLSLPIDNASRAPVHPSHSTTGMREDLLNMTLRIAKRVSDAYRSRSPIWTRSRSATPDESGTDVRAASNRQSIRRLSGVTSLQTPSRRNVQVYNDELPASSQPQTPRNLPDSRHRSRFDGPFTAPAGRVSARNLQLYRGSYRGERSHSPVGMSTPGFQGLYGGQENTSDDVLFEGTARRLWALRESRAAERSAGSTPDRSLSFADDRGDYQ